jgi:BirA family transcriptional regulator, biotin operon repressor / biotin---[acetyl-CoA-carboxylase] ligase
MFDLEQLRRHDWLRGVEFHDAIESTNVRSAELAAGNAIRCPHLVLAATQSAGKGRGANRWWSSAGALTCSLLIEPEELGLRSEQWPRTSLCAALAVRDVIAERAPSDACGVKWPNDVYHSGRKICGVLVEAPPRKVGLPHRLVIGIGVNVNNSLATAPAEVQSLATSLADLTGRPHDLTDVLFDIVSRLAENLALLAGDVAKLPERWQRHALLDGRTVTVDMATRKVTGYCLGINAQGALDLATEFGVEAIHAGVVSSISPPLRAE